ncbi:hypothetical protein [Luteimonas terrae]|uniref:DUF4304 domain-containing protein n=1 Tax=Luteimonas terrae TaxID=1530191 RepID=A0ABU1XX93_9GAMM|nr:hypothetical protein [Luteimonas terrae]MDR7193380.1 hypothetical protein [Luteimonas terrae]
MVERACSLERFRKGTAEHQMEIVLDSGTHRHLRFSKPGTSCYSFNIVTWPGYLAISGDMGASVFSRLPDMLEFFRADQKWQADNPDRLYINTGYWAEKLVANDGSAKVFAADRLEVVLKERFDDFMAEIDLEEIHEGKELADMLWRHLTSQVRGEDVREVIEAGMEFEPEEYEGYGGAGDPGFEAFKSFRLADFWESASELEEYSFHLVWRMYAIAHAVIAYDTHHAAATSGSTVEMEA